MKTDAAIAVIGAGMAGAAAARRLRDAGAQVTLFEKSRGLGGRLATRRMEEGAFDHGAQFIRAKSERFRTMMEQWRAGGLVEPWSEDRFVGVPAMNAPVKALIGDIPVMNSFTVTGLAREESFWRILAENGAYDARFDAVLSAVPSPQARPILASAGWSPAALAEERYAPCWAAMLGYEDALDLPEFISVEDEAVAWIADNSSKPDRTGPGSCIVIHATPVWTRAHLESEAEEVLAILFMRFAGITGIMREPAFGAAHRWRHALVEKPLGETHLWNPGERLGACGDWCIGARIEAAFESGEALARAVIETL